MESTQLVDIKRIDYFLLADKWKEKGVDAGRISYSIRTSGDKDYHDMIVRNKIRELLNKNDDDYSSWVHTSTIYECMHSIQPHCSVIHFRIREVY